MVIQVAAGTVGEVDPQRVGGDARAVLTAGDHTPACILECACNARTANQRSEDERAIPIHKDRRPENRGARLHAPGVPPRVDRVKLTVGWAVLYGSSVTRSGDLALDDRVRRFRWWAASRCVQSLELIAASCGLRLSDSRFESSSPSGPRVRVGEGQTANRRHNLATSATRK